jgi:transcription elongation factor GreA
MLEPSAVIRAVTRTGSDEERTMAQTYTAVTMGVPVRESTRAMRLSQQETTALTPAGRASLAEEMRRLRDEYLPTLVRQLAEARDDPATLKEAGDLLAVQQEQHRVQQRVAELEWLLAVARDVAPPVDGVFALGSHVEVADDGEVVAYQLVNPCEANLAEGRVSIASPVGQALIGHAAGDEVVVEAPAGQRRLRVVAVS